MNVKLMQVYKLEGTAIFKRKSIPKKMARWFIENDTKILAVSLSFIVFKEIVIGVLSIPFVQETVKDLLQIFRG